MLLVLKAWLTEEELALLMLAGAASESCRTYVMIAAGLRYEEKVGPGDVGQKVRAGRKCVLEAAGLCRIL
jgi:hypothetical protein